MRSKLFKALAAVTAAVTAFSSAAFGADYPVFKTDDVVKVGEQCYKLVGENLFHNGEFDDITGNGLDQWYNGVHTGHDENNADAPGVDGNGNITKVTPLKNNLSVNGYEILDHPFYFGQDGKRGLEYLVENVAGDWSPCVWNGKSALLSFVKIEPNKTYYFSFRHYVLSDKASIRYGAIDIENYAKGCKADAKESNITFSGSGYKDCWTYGEQNIGVAGQWRREETIISPGEGATHFFFNAYWLQVPAFLCLDDFKLYEVTETTDSTTTVTGAEMTTSLAASGNDLGIGISITGGQHKGFDLFYYNNGWTQFDNMRSLDETTALISNNSNINWQIKPWTAQYVNNDVTYGTEKSTSLYEEVINDLVDNKDAYSAEGFKVDSGRLAAYNKVLSKGGILSPAGLADVQKNIMTANATTDGYVISINEPFRKLGIGFVYEKDLLNVGNVPATADGSAETYYYLAVKMENGNVTSAVLSKEDPAAPASNVMEGETVTLDAVQLEFVEEIVEEIQADDGFEVVFDSFEDIM